MEKYYLERILQIVKDCQTVQESGESTYFKETEKQTAYDDIKDEVLAWERIRAQS